MTFYRFLVSRIWHKTWHTAHPIPVLSIGILASLLPILTFAQESERVSPVLSADVGGLSPMEMTMALITAVIAIAGIFTAAAAIRQARAVEVSNKAFLEAQKVAVTPHLELEVVEDNEKAGLDLINTGLGPAEILEFTIYLDRKPIEPLDVVSSWVSVAKELGWEESDRVKICALTPGSWVTSGQRLQLLGMDMAHPDASAEFARFMKRRGFRIVYKSRYGEEKTLEKHLG